jgi:hypothetical protein
MGRDGYVCARATSGHAAAVPPRSVMKSRACSFNDLVGDGEQPCRHRDAERSRNLKVDDELKFGRLEYATDFTDSAGLAPLRIEPV